MPRHVNCPTCSMTASPHDRRLLTPILDADGHDVRRCRNCGALFDLDEQTTARGRVVHGRRVNA